MYTRKSYLQHLQNFMGKLLEMKGKPELIEFLGNESETGVCSLLQTQTGAYTPVVKDRYKCNAVLHKLYQDFFLVYSEFTGNPLYPIGVRGSDIDEVELYHDGTYESMWVEGDYAEARWRFIEELNRFLIQLIGDCK